MYAAGWLLSQSLSFELVGAVHNARHICGETEMSFCCQSDLMQQLQPLNALSSLGAFQNYKVTKFVSYKVCLVPIICACVQKLEIAFATDQSTVRMLAFVVRVSDRGWYGFVGGW